MPQHHKGKSYHPRETAGQGPPGEQPSDPLPPPPSIPDSILQFLNALPTSGNAAEWVAAFRALLQGLFEDVDHVEVRVDLHCPLVTDQAQAVRARSAAGVRRTRHSVDEQGPLIVIASPDASPAAYQPPTVFDYRYAGGAYLGSVLLRRENGKDSISDATNGSMTALEPFMLFALSDLVARYSYAKPIGRTFHEVLRGIALERGLTRRELEVLTLHLFGRKYDEIARRLYISIDTVKKHVKRIHRKTEARSAMELFARYFTPLIDDEDQARKK